jgi:hypothetical protein
MNTFAFHLTLDSNILQLPDIKRFIGKEVIVTIVELPQNRQPQKRNWRFLGATKLKQGLDNINIRDLAYE